MPANRVLLTLLFIATIYPAPLPAAEPGTFEDLGVQITSMTLQGTTFARSPDGRDLVCTVIRGQPAKLLVYDIKSGEPLQRLTLEGANGAWNATTASDGSVYVGTDDNGHLYRWMPGDAQIHDLGQVAPAQTFVWDVAPGEDGEIFCATYPGCMVVRYHPADGFSDVSRGPAAPGEDYARALTYDPETRRIFVGVGAKAHLVQLDAKSGEKKDILPAKYGEKKFVYGVDAVFGKLFAMLTDDAKTVVFDIASGEEEATLPTGLQIISPPSPYGRQVYFNSGGQISVYDLDTRKHAIVGAIGRIPVIALEWVPFGEPDFPGPTLVALSSRGRLVRYHPKTGAVDWKQLKIPPENVPIQSIAAGPDGKIYSGGYLVGGLTVFDPVTGKHAQIGNAGQPESMGAYGDRSLYLGIYPRARLKVFDTGKPFGSGNPLQFEELDRFDQDRPFATLGVEPLKKVFFGTVSDYGALGGALSVHDVETGKTDVFRNVVPQQSIISLAYASGLVVGGTTVAGGLGIKPTEKEAKLFLWDPQASARVFETVPVPGARIVSGLTVGPDANIWGVAGGDLFVFDVAAREVVRSRRLFPDQPPGNARWRDASLAVHPDGHVYGTAGSRFFRLDPQTLEATTLRRGVGLLAMDREGRLYFRDLTNLWRYTPTPASTSSRP